MLENLLIRRGGEVAVQIAAELFPARADKHDDSSLSRCCTSSRSICWTRLLALKTVPTCNPSRAGGLGARAAFEGGEPKGLPGVRLDTLPDAGAGQVEQLLVEARFQPTGQVVACRDGVEDGRRWRCRRCPGPPRRQPSTKSLQAWCVRVRSRPRKRRAGSYGKGAQVMGELEQDALGDVLGVGWLHLPVAAPAVDQRAVAGDELLPRGLVVGLGAEPQQQAGPRS